MNEKFEDFKRLIIEVFPKASVTENGIIYFDYEAITIACANLPNDPDNVIFRAQVVALSDVGRPKDFAIEALSGNFFWEGTNGGTLSVSSDDIMYLTDKCLIDDFREPDDILNFLDDFTEAVGDWKVRSNLYA